MIHPIIENLPFSSQYLTTLKNENEKKSNEKKILESTALSTHSSSLSNNIFLKKTNLNQVNELRKNLNTNTVFLIY